MVSIKLSTILSVLLMTALSFWIFIQVIKARLTKSKLTNISFILFGVSGLLAATIQIANDFIKLKEYTIFFVAAMGILVVCAVTLMSFDSWNKYKDDPFMRKVDSVVNVIFLAIILITAIIVLIFKY